MFASDITQCTCILLILPTVVTCMSHDDATLISEAREVMVQSFPSMNSLPR